MKLKIVMYHDRFGTEALRYDNRNNLEEIEIAGGGYLQREYLLIWVECNLPSFEKMSEGELEECVGADLAVQNLINYIIEYNCNAHVVWCDVDTDEYNEQLYGTCRKMIKKVTDSKFMIEDANV